MKQIILLYGEDHFSIEAFEKKFISEKVDPQWETFNLNIINGSDYNPEALADKIVESADSPPLGFGNKVTLVKNADAVFSLKEELLGPLENLLNKNLMEGNFLIFSASGIDKRRNFAKNLLKVAEAREFAAIKPWELGKKLYPWVEDTFRKLDKRIEKEAVEELVDASGANKHRLEREVEKLVLYTGESKFITIQDVRSLVVNTESDLFEFLALLAKKDLSNALIQINKLLLREPAIKLLSSLASNFRTVYNIKLLAEEQMNNVDIAKNLSQKPFLVEKNLKAWRSFNTEKLRLIMQDLLMLDFKFKTSSVNHRMELEKFIVKNFS